MLSASEVRTLQTAAKGFEEIGSILAKSGDYERGMMAERCMEYG